MKIQRFMQGYQAAWEERNPAMFAALFHPDGQYHNTPFQTQRGTAQLAEYWKRVHWHVTYQVASEELFQVWARSTGTNLVARKPGAPLPRMVLDGVLQARFEDGLCAEARIWWHSQPQAV